MMPDASCSSMALAPSVLPEFDPARRPPGPPQAERGVLAMVGEAQTQIAAIGCLWCALTMAARAAA